MASTPALFKHQKVSVNKFLPLNRGLDLSDPGTGKTRVQIELFNIRRKRGGKCALVLAPKSLLDTAWRDDFNKFAPHMKVSVAHAKNREKAFEADADVYITNTDAAKWLVQQPASFFKKFDTLIIDEITSFKHRTSQRSRAMNKIKKFFPFRYGMTGTPNANTICDIWHPMFLIDDGKRLSSSFFHFRAQTCTPVQVGPMANMIKWEDKPGAEMAVAALLQDLIVRHRFEECVDIPENFTHPIAYHLSEKQLRVYEEMAEHAIAEVRSGKVIDAINGASVMTKLLQIASGAVYDGEGKYDVIDAGRYELIADLVDQRKHSVVFFNWTHQRDQLIKEFESRGLTYVVMDGEATDKERASAVDLFQKGFYRVFLAHPASAAHGLTLTKGTSTIWSSPTYNLEHFLQGNRRIYRAGQTQKTETILVLAEGTLENKVYARLQEKNVRQSGLLDILKEFA